MRYLPPVFTTADLAEALGWPVQRVRRYCLRHGLCQHDRDPREHLTLTYSLLLERSPDLYYSLLAAGVIRVSPSQSFSERH